MDIEKVHCNIEYAHFYVNEALTDKHVKSIETLKSIISDINESGKSFCSCVWVDDYHPVFSDFKMNTFIESLSKFDAKPDFLGFESRMVPVAEMLLNYVPDTLKKMEVNKENEILYLNYSENKFMGVLGSKVLFNRIPLELNYPFSNKYTCALLSAAWALTRLGIFKVSGEVLQLNGKKSFHGDNIITILPKKYKRTEKWQ